MLIELDTLGPMMYQSSLNLTEAKIQNCIVAAGKAAHCQI